MDNIFDIKFPIELKVKENVILKFSNKQGGDYNIFSYYWQCFVWAATIGFLRNERRTLAKGIERIFSLKTMRGNDGERDAQALLCMCIARYGSVDIMKDPQEAIKYISEYANAGFYHIMQLMENGENTFNDMEKVKQEIFARDYDCDSNTEAILTDADDNEVSEETDDEEPVAETTTEDKPWSDDETDLLITYYNNDAGVKRIADRLKRSVDSVEQKMASLGLIELPLDVTVKNTSSKGFLFNKKGEEVYSTDGQLKIFNNKVYRFNLKSMCLTVKDIVLTDDGWDKGGKKLVAYSGSALFTIVQPGSFVNDIEDFVEGDRRELNKIKVSGAWFDYYGDMVTSDFSIKENLTQSYNNSDSTKTTKRWSAAERRELQSYYESGMSTEKLANYFGTSEDNVIEVLKKLKIYR